VYIGGAEEDAEEEVGANIVVVPTEDDEEYTI
jgi:hypothetical protein